MDNEKEVFFVGIREPSELRKDLLGSVKKIVHCFKRYENLNSLREEKIKLILSLRKTLKEVSFLNNKLKAIFPQTKLRALPQKRAVEIKESVFAKKTVMRKETDELAQLESELAALEEKIGSNKA